MKGFGSYNDFFFRRPLTGIQRFKEKKKKNYKGFISQTSTAPHPHNKKNKMTRSGLHFGKVFVAAEWRMDSSPLSGDDLRGRRSDPSKT